MFHAFIDFAAVDCGSPRLRAFFAAPKEILQARSLTEVRPVMQAVHERSLAGKWCVGFVRYEAASAWDSALQTHSGTQPLVWFGIHDAPLALAPHDLGVSPTAQATWEQGLPYAEFTQAVGSLQTAIADGAIYQANFTAQLGGTLEGSAWSFFQQLQHSQPQGFAAYIDTGGEQVLSVSPELFFDWHQGRLLCRPMKGTALRGSTPQSDAAQAQALQNSPKERAENVMIVDLIRNDLSKVAVSHSVHVDALCRLQALPTVWQMVSDVSAQTRVDRGLDDVFAALFPCGSVTGAPKVKAMSLIRDLERSERGVYCGAVGVVRPGGSATFNVPIRTVTAQGHALQLGTGSAITADATPSAEWREWQHKRAFALRASQPFELLETLRLDQGHWQHQPAHVARLQASAQHFGFAFCANTLEQHLSALQAQHPQAVYRVRLLLNASGHIDVQAHAMPTTPAQVNLRLADQAHAMAFSEFTRHKTTRREHYDAFSPTDPDVFDTVLWNCDGEITECTRGNVAALMDGQWVTPPLHCGLLAGVGRAHWLAQGRITERVIHLNDVPRVQAWGFINSLRGWIDAELLSANA